MQAKVTKFIIYFKYTSRSNNKKKKIEQSGKLMKYYF